MLQKFKTSTYATLLLTGLFVLPYMVEAVDRIENASNRFGCGDTYEELRDCMETVVSTRDASIDQLNAELSSVGAAHEKAIEELQAQADKAKEDIRGEMQAAVDKATEELVEMQAALDKAEADKVELQAALDNNEAEKGELTTAVDTLKAEKTELQAAVDKAEEEKVELQAAVDKAEAEKVELQAAVDKAETEKTELQAAVDKAERKNVKLQAALDKRGSLIVREGSIRTSDISQSDVKLIQCPVPHLGGAYAPSRQKTRACGVWVIGGSHAYGREQGEDWLNEGCLDGDGYRVEIERDEDGATLVCEKPKATSCRSVEGDWYDCECRSHASGNIRCTPN